MDREKFNSLLESAYLEKERTDGKYGPKEVGNVNKATLVAIIVEELGTFLSEQRKGKSGEEHYIKALAHFASLSAHIDQAKPGAQYIEKK